MFPIFIAGVGWVFQPAFRFDPGCVYSPGQPKRFGFGRSAAGVLSALLLLWLCLDHPVEVIAAVGAALAVEVLTRLFKAASRSYRRGGGHGWQHA
ncbi:hypothetical protein OG265_36785 (plasmid) [Streptomyces sp. NBC_01208]|nr:hypothetical protein [Streptomyces sp. NBC_01208]WSR11543.1 hypothetical protein OG265_36785 [Streptomyces sp. NBC_01208]